MAHENSAGFRADIPPEIGPFKQLLQEYSRIPPEKVDSHIHDTVSVQPNARKEFK